MEGKKTLGDDEDKKPQKDQRRSSVEDETEVNFFSSFFFTLSLYVHFSLVNLLWLTLRWDHHGNGLAQALDRVYPASVAARSKGFHLGSHRNKTWESSMEQEKRGGFSSWMTFKWMKPTYFHRSRQRSDLSINTKRSSANGKANCTTQR